MIERSKVQEMIKYPVVEFCGPDRSGKSSIIDLIRCSLGDDKFSREMLIDRGLFDSLVLDYVFHRDTSSSSLRIQTLNDMLFDKHLAIVFVKADPDVLFARQEAFAGDIDESMNKKLWSKDMFANMVYYYDLLFNSLKKTIVNGLVYEDAFTMIDTSNGLTVSDIERLPIQSIEYDTDKLQELNVRN